MKFHKFSLLAATAAALNFAVPIAAQTTDDGAGSGATTGAGTDMTTTVPLPTPDDNMTTGQTGQDTGGGNDANSAAGANTSTGTATTGQATGTTDPNAAATTGTTATGVQAGAAADPQILQKMSEVTQAAEFVNIAAMSNLFEIQSGSFAQENVKGKMAGELAKKIVSDHTATNKQLMELARSAQIDDQPPTQLDQRHQQMLDNLRKAAEDPDLITGSTSAAGAPAASGSDGDNAAADGSAAGDPAKLGGTSSAEDVVGDKSTLTVDQVFAQQQVQAHQEAIALFRAYSENGDNQELKQFAEESLPGLEEHLKMTQELVKAQEELVQKQSTQQ
jgi:putative membrane protein